jgi:hypothetical protein
MTRSEACRHIWTRRAMGAPWSWVLWAGGDSGPLTHVKGERQMPLVHAQSDVCARDILVVGGRC